MKRFAAAACLLGTAGASTCRTGAESCLEEDQASLLQGAGLLQAHVAADGSWGRPQQGKYCSGSHSKHSSERKAKNACVKDNSCGGVYMPGNSPGEWYLCKGFDLASSNSGSVSIEMLSRGTSPSPSYEPSPSPSYEPPPSPSVEVSWGPKERDTYCTNEYGKETSKRKAKKACEEDSACGGIYKPGNSDDEWFLCKGFYTYPSNSGSVVMEKLTSSSSPSPSPSHRPSPSPSYMPSPSPSDQAALSWSLRLNHKYCTGSYDKHSSEAAAKDACANDHNCGGVYMPGNSPGEWFLCPGFDIYDSSSESVVVEKLD